MACITSFGRRETPLHSVMVSCALVLAACRGDSTAPDTGTPGVRITSQTTRTDTIGAFLPELVTVQVRRPDGTLATQTPVRLTPSVSEARSGAGQTRVIDLAICKAKAQFCGSGGLLFVIDTTDERGTIQFSLRLGTRSGTAYLRMEVPDYNFVDSAAFTIRPGAPSQVLKPTSDTGIAIGDTLRLAAQMADRAMNATAGEFAQIGSVTLGQLTASTGLYTATTFGTEWVRYSAGSVTDSLRVRVVPSARLLAYHINDARLAMLDVTGRNVRLITGQGTLLASFGLVPRFDASQQNMILPRSFQGGGGGPFTVAIVDTSGAPVRRSATFNFVRGYRVMPDGTMLVVGKVADIDFFSPQYDVYRVALDGTVTTVAALTQWPSVLENVIAISPDGRTLAYAANRSASPFTPVAPQLEVRDIASGAVTVLATGGGLRPLWSPSGSQIAYLTSTSTFQVQNATLAVINADGSGARQLAVGEVTALSWSPSGEYLLVRPQGSVQVMRVRDGVTVTTNARVSDYSVFDWR